MSYANGPESRKGTALLSRLSIEVPFESTIEERVLRLLDFTKGVFLFDALRQSLFTLPMAQSMTTPQIWWSSW